ncbi:esterase/lipase family protein [Lacipirellula sp.]|uniref:esterase/lipase family protein n=1 Tax=Lacipirellula sp. TaxID=2691419 RepID=UPI003D11911B
MVNSSLSPVPTIALIAMALIGGCSKEKPNAKPSPPVKAIEAVNAIGGTENERRRADVVFVHGLQGDFQETWQKDSDSSNYWPKWLSDDNPDLGIWSVNYEASSSNWFGSSMPIQDRATTLLEELRLRGIGKRPLLFVTHSMGGLVVKQMLNDALTQDNERWEAIADNTKGVVFIATPNSGSGAEKFLKLLGPLYNESVQGEQLEQNAPMLRKLNTWYRNNIPDHDIQTLVFFENKPIIGIGLIVDEGSSDPGINDVTPIRLDGDHRSICKPGARTDQIYMSVQDFANEHLIARERIDISFPQFVDDFNEKRNGLLVEFKKEYVNKTVTWDAVIRDIVPDKEAPAYSIAPDNDTPMLDRVMASFSPIEFNNSLPIGSSVKLEGTISERTNRQGAILIDCKTLQRLNKTEGD